MTDPRSALHEKPDEIAEHVNALIRHFGSGEAVIAALTKDKPSAALSQTTPARSTLDQSTLDRIRMTLHRGGSITNEDGQWLIDQLAAQTTPPPQTHTRVEVTTPTCDTCVHLTPFELAPELCTCPVVNIRIHRDSTSVFGCNQHERLPTHAPTLTAALRGSLRGPESDAEFDLAVNTFRELLPTHAPKPDILKALIERWESEAALHRRAQHESRTAPSAVADRGLAWAFSQCASELREAAPSVSSVPPDRDTDSSCGEEG
jgi:hypothetical protein